MAERRFRKVKGEKMDEAKVPSANRVSYPHLYLDFKVLPEAKGWKIGGKYRIALEVIQTSMDTHHGKMGEEGSVGLEIRGIKVMNEEKEHTAGAPRRARA